tara:strand:+ start:181 stop:930 length:750 start_codon:yes stop_codon:yes gene_type:complete
MQKNGLEQRSRERKVGLWVGGVSSFFLISFFLVPFYLPTDSVPELSGRANSFDYQSEDAWGNVQTDGNGGMGHNQSEYGSFVWSDLDPYAAFIYAFGDLNCHNKAERSWEINGNQMPVCVRDVGIFLGLAIGGFWFSRKGFNRWTIRDTFLSLLPDDRLLSVYKNDKRLLAMFVIAAVGAVPMAIDGFTQMLTSYESTAFMRLLTGTPFGILIGAFMSASFSARPAFFELNPANVMLPSGSRFSMKEEE